MKRGKILLLSVILLILLAVISLVYASSFENSKNQLKVTLEHPFFINNEWIKAKDLSVGNELYLSDGRKAKITNIKDIIEKNLVYNLEVKDYENYVANGIVVHNSKKPIVNSEYFSYNWGKGSELVGGEAGMEEWILIDAPDSGLAKTVRESYEQSLGKVSSSSSLEEIVQEAERFSKEMKKSLPFLGQKNIDSLENSESWATMFRQYSDMIAPEYNPTKKDLFLDYLSMSTEGNSPRLSELGRTGKLDCTGQVLTIRQTLGGEGSGWEIYHDFVVSNDKFKVTADGSMVTRPHTFLAKEFELSDGRIIYIKIDPTEGGFRIPTRIGEFGKPSQANPNRIYDGQYYLPAQVFESTGYVRADIGY